MNEHFFKGKSKKIWRIVGIIVVLSIIIISILIIRWHELSKDNALVPASKTSTDNNKVKINFSYQSGEFGTDIENSIKEFNRNNTKSIEVETMKIPSDKYEETLNMLFTSGESPDVFEIGSDWISGYIAKGWVANLRKYCSRDFIEELPYWMDIYVPDLDTTGEVFTLPSGQMTIRLIYNKDLFREAGLDPNLPPKTMDDLKLYAKKISNSQKGYKKYGFALTAGDGRRCFEQFMEASNTFSGVYYYDFKQGKYNLLVYEKWLGTIRDMVINESLFPGAAILKYDNALNQFAEGNIGMMYANSAAPKVLQELLANKNKICDWDVAMPPSIDQNSYGKGRVSIIPSNFYCVSERFENKEAAAEFWKYLYSEEHLSVMYENDGIMPSINNEEYIKKYSPNIEKFNKFIPTDNDAFYPLVPRVADDWTRFDKYTEAIDSKEPVLQVLMREDENLNFQFSHPGGSRSNILDYSIPNFDWLNPIKR